MIIPEATKLAFESLARRGLITRKGKLVNPKRFWSALANLTCPQLVEIAEEITEYFRISELSRVSSHVEKSFFTHRASLLLGGSPSPADRVDVGCRLYEAEHLSRFTLLYSDRVYINNFFGRYSHVAHAEDSGANRTTLREWLLDDIYLFSKLRPLLLDGKLVMISPPIGVCPACWSVKGLGAAMSRKVGKLRKRLESDFLKSSIVSIRRDEDDYTIEVEVPEYLSPHATKWTHKHVSIPRTMKGRRELILKLKGGETIKLSTTMAEKLGDLKDFAKNVTNNISFEILSSRFINSSFVTSSQMDVDLLTGLAKDREIERRNILANKFLTSYVPFLEGWDVDSIIKLRHREEESFSRFRRALNDAMKELLDVQSTISERTAQQLYCDVIAPRLQELDQRVCVAQRTLIKNLYRPTIALVGVISVGLFLNIIPGNWVDLIKILGIGKASCDILENALAAGDAHEAIEEQDFYFLWKVRQLTPNN